MSTQNTGVIAIKAGKLWDGLAERPRENAYVTVSQGRILAMGSQGDLAGAQERFAQVLDLGAGATLLPGLINMHVHMAFSAGPDILADHQSESLELRTIRAVENLKASLRTGVTTVRDCATVNPIAFAVRDAVERGLLVAPRVVAAGAGITTTGGHCWFCGVEADGELALRRAVREQVKAGADFIKLFATGGNSTPGTNPLAAQYTVEEMTAAVQEAKRLGKRVASHAHGTPGVHASIAARVTTIEHCTFLTAGGIAYEPEQARIIAGEGLYVVPTIFQGVGKLVKAEDPDLPPRHKGFLEIQRGRFQLVRSLVEQGVKIVSGNDAGVSWCEFGDYPGDLVLTQRGTGLSPAWVLKTATSAAAEALGRADLGVIAPGKVADLLAVRGNPLEDMASLHNVIQVIARGQVLPAA